VRTHLDDQSLEVLFIHLVPNDVLVRPFGHRPGERPAHFFDEGPEVGGKDLGVGSTGAQAAPA